ncbi:MAG: hypothetical protein IJ083_08055 [Clostridia bacterium]|nr:hypothetical protein [Clostridia bacterium]
MSQIYQARVSVKGRGTSVYRIMAFKGDESSDKVVMDILFAFDFDLDHMYRFTPYGVNPWRSSAVEHEDGYCLDDIIDTFGTKFTLLYDFGDEWMFQITIQKVLPTFPGSVIKSVGKVSQYGYDDEEDEEE